MTNIQQYIRGKLLGFQIGTPEPKWSSYLLDEVFSTVISGGGNVGDILQSLYELLAYSNLSEVAANFNRDIGRMSFSRFKDSYLASDLKWMREAVSGGCTAPQAHLALQTLPVSLLNSSCVLSILKALAGTSFWPEAVSNFEYEAKNPELRQRLREWLLSGVESHCRHDVEKLAGISG